MRPPRLASVLLLVPLAVFLTAFQLDLYAKATHAKSTKSKSKSSSTGKAKSAQGTSKGSAKSSTNKGSASKGSTKSTGKAGASKKGSGKGGKRTKSGKKGAPAPAATKSYRQQSPDSDRIREIQKALSERGYPLEATGAWDAATIDALKKFQTAQNIENLSGRGKLDSLTLIALGLGPKREPPVSPSPSPQRSAEGPIP